MPDTTATPAQVLDFWFGPPGTAAASRPEWFRKSAEFDEEIRRHFGVTHALAREGGLVAWEEPLHDRLALVLVLDQFSRNLYRDRAEAFACDARALKLAQRTVADGADTHLTPLQRWFLYLPFEHAESLAAQDESVRLFEQLEAYPETVGVLEWARRHAEVVARFGRFPHRNAALGRVSTPEEQAFLAQPGSGF